MIILTNNYFHKQLDRYGLGMTYVLAMVEDIGKGRSTPLGNKLYKIRAAGLSSGKSGGFRNIFFWKKDELVVFCYLFSKGQQGNISSTQFKELTILADQYEQLTGKDIEQLIQDGKLWRIGHDQKEKP